MTNFKPGERVLLALVVPREGRITTGADGQEVRQEPTFSGVIEHGEITEDAQRVRIPGHEGTMEIDPRTVFHLGDEDKANASLAQALEMIDKL